ncbi:high-affinity Fe2+/Pb2+ permease [Streptococcus pneumoniae]|nr:high-affinity Fe2+/Pb2+ permease [Streptococcus pneumoniae]
MSISPRFETLEQAIASKDLEKVREAFKKMNSTWTINESVVRDNSIAHYGRVETAISFLPSSMEIEPLVAWKSNLQMSLEHENSS